MLKSKLESNHVPGKKQSLETTEEPIPAYGTFTPKSSYMIIIQEAFILPIPLKEMKVTQVTVSIVNTLWFTEAATHSL